MLVRFLAESKKGHIVCLIHDPFETQHKVHSYSMSLQATRETNAPCLCLHTRQHKNRSKCEGGLTVERTHGTEAN